MDSKELDKWREAGKIGTEALAYARKIVKPGMKLLDLAEEIEEFIKKEEQVLHFQ